MILSAEEISTRKFGKLQMKFPKTITSGSGKKEIWVCDCGKEVLISVRDIISGNTSSCGRCNEISAEEMSIRKFGKLRMKDPKYILPGSNNKTLWICDCGREKPIKINSVVSGVTKSCGHCNEISAEKISIRKFGKLRMKDPKVILPGSNKKEIWICDCGKETMAQTASVVSGGTISCGRCRDSVYDWYLKNKEHLYSLKCPINSEDFPSGGPIPLEVIKTVHGVHKFKCISCGKIYHPRLHDIKQNKSLTCGCSTYRMSSGQKDVSLFIESLGFETKLEHSINKLKYDIFVPAKNLLIEYDGTRWHNMRGSKERDLRKEQNAIAFEYNFFRITEEEWTKNKKRVENQLRSMLIVF